MGHRSALSRLEIRKISGPTAAKAAAGSGAGRSQRSTARKEPANTEEKED
jgi:hypothetical protein